MSQALFSLSLSEARVAALLVLGRTLREIATRMEMTYETVRFVLKQIFVKIDVHTQAELVAVLSEALHRTPPVEAASNQSARFSH